jgi:hypothetical protein
MSNAFKWGDKIIHFWPYDTAHEHHTLCGKEISFVRNDGHGVAASLEYVTCEDCKLLLQGRNKR